MRIFVHRKINSDASANASLMSKRSDLIKNDRSISRYVYSVDHRFHCTHVNPYIVYCGVWLYTKIKPKHTPSIITRTTGDVGPLGDRLICISASPFVFSHGSIVLPFSIFHICNNMYVVIVDVVRKMAKFASSYCWYTDSSRIQFCADVQLSLSAHPHTHTVIFNIVQMHLKVF